MINKSLHIDKKKLYIYHFSYLHCTIIVTYELKRAINEKNRFCGKTKYIYIYISALSENLI